VRKPFVWCCYALILLGAYRWTYSTSGFLITAIGLSLLLDRYVFRQLPWRSFDTSKEIAIRLTSFLAGGTIFYCLRPGVVPVWEAAYRGASICLTGFLFEQLLLLLPRLRWLVCGLTLAVLLVLIPFAASLHPIHTTPKRTPNALGLDFEDVRFSASDGVELAGWFLPHPHPRGNLIFCHGHGRNRGHVAALLPTFHNLGLNVLAFDFRGHGESTGHTSTFGFREVQDLLAAEAYLRDRCPHRPLLLSGISLGAAVTLQTLPYLHDVRGVWCESSFARFSNAVDYKFSALPDCLRVPLIGSYYALGWLDCRIWVPSVNPVNCLDGLSTPIFFCHGERDELVPPSEARMLFDRYAGPKQHWWVAGSSHYNVRQRNHSEYLHRLRTFFENCLSTS
jgi:fermentation-respiration switch protein FrsA (DUF1100 family)